MGTSNENSDKLKLNENGGGRTAHNNVTSDNIQTRNALKSLGFSDDRIGYDGTYVTIDGQAAIEPTENNNGVTKTTVGNLIRGANQAYKTSGTDNSIVDVTSYAAEKTQLQNAVNYNNDGTVTLGSIPIQNVLIIDGNAYAPKEEIEKAFLQFQANTGYSTNTDKVNSYLKKTKSSADNYANQIENYGPFSYDPETDPAYAAYKEAYIRNAQRALDDTYAQLAARTGGYTNTAAASAASQAYYNHMSELADRIPELMSNSYSRYMGDYNMLLNKLELYGSPLDRANLEANAAQDAADRVQQAVNAGYTRDVYNKEQAYNRMLDERDFNYTKEQNDWYRNNMYVPQSNMLKLEYENALNAKDIEQAILNEQLKEQQMSNQIMKKKYKL